MSDCLWIVACEFEVRDVAVEFLIGFLAPLRRERLMQEIVNGEGMTLRETERYSRSDLTPFTRRHDTHNHKKEFLKHVC